MNPRPNAMSARIAVYAVAVGHELGFAEEVLIRIRQIAEGEIPALEHEVVQLAIAFCEWQNSDPANPDSGQWTDASFTPESLEALERVRPLIQPMNG